MAVWDESLFFPAMKAAGMLSKARVLVEGATETVCVDVDYQRPDFDFVSGSRSQQHRIEYQAKDLPTLGEGDQVQITEPDGTVSTFLVREEPYAAETQPSGFFLRVLLTKVPG